MSGFDFPSILVAPIEGAAHLHRRCRGEIHASTWLEEKISEGYAVV
jgi:hypothetical protein